LSLTDKILNDRIFKSLSDGMSEIDKANLEKSIREMLSPAEDFYYKILDMGSTEEGVEKLSDAIKPVIAPTDFEDVKK
jgi:hypothetical protein